MSNVVPGRRTWLYITSLPAILRCTLSPLRGKRVNTTYAFLTFDIRMLMRFETGIGRSFRARQLWNEGIKKRSHFCVSSTARNPQIGFMYPRGIRSRMEFIRFRFYTPLDVDSSRTARLRRQLRSIWPDYVCIIAGLCVAFAPKLDPLV